jgi:hypothetical protein
MAPFALAAYSPKLSAATNDDATYVDVSTGAADSPTAAVTLYVPAGWGANFYLIDSDVVGTVSGQGVAADSGGKAVDFKGVIHGGTATTSVTYGGATTTVGSLAASCVGTANASAVEGYWVAQLSVAGQTVQIPMYLIQIFPLDPQSQFASFAITTCFPPPDVAAGTAGRAPLGLKITDWNLSLTEGVTPFQPAWYVWESQATPYGSGTGQALSTGTVEIQSVDRYPFELTSSTKPLAGSRGQLVVSGRLSEGGKGVANTPVSVLVGKKVVGKASTGGKGTYTLKIAASKSAKVWATATVATRTLPSCLQPVFAPMPCTSSTIGGFTATSS